MTTNNLSDALYSERVEKILNTSVELIDEEMALELEKEWKKVERSLLDFPEIFFGNDKNINSIPFNNQILTIRNPKGYIYIKLFIEDNKKIWELKVSSRHPSGAMVNIKTNKKIEEKWIANPEIISYELLRGGMISQIRRNFYSHYGLFCKILEYRSFLFEKYTDPLMKFFDVDEIYASKKNRSFLAKKDRVIVLEGLSDDTGTDVKLFLLCSHSEDYKERDYKSISVVKDSLESGVIQRKRLFKFTKEELAAHFTVVRNLKNGDMKNSTDNIILPLLSIMKGYEKEDNKSAIDKYITERLNEIINKIFSDCKFPDNPFKVSEYLDNVNELRKSIKNTLTYVCNSIKGITIECDRDNDSYLEVSLKLNSEFSKEDAEKNFLMICAYNEKEGSKSFEKRRDDKLYTLINYAHSLFFLYNNITLDMICYMSDEDTIKVRKTDTFISESILRQKIDNMMEGKTNLLEILNESTVGNY